MPLHRTLEDNFDCHNLAENVTGLKAIVCVCVFVLMDGYVHACVHCVYMYVNVYIYACVYACMCMRVCGVCACVCVRTHGENTSVKRVGL